MIFMERNNKGCRKSYFATAFYLLIDKFSNLLIEC